METKELQECLNDKKVNNIILSFDEKILVTLYSENVKQLLLYFNQYHMTSEDIDIYRFLQILEFFINHNCKLKNIEVKYKGNVLNRIRTFWQYLKIKVFLKST